MPLLTSWSTRTRSRSRSSQPTSMLRRPPATAKSCWLCKGRLSNTLLPSCCTSWPVRLFWASHESSWGNFHKNSLNPVENYINKVSIRMRLSLVKQWLAEIYSSPRRGGWKEKPIPHICHFFTQAKFSEKKIYTKIYTVNCQFTL